MTTAVVLILERIRDYLEEKIPEADVIKLGRLQDNPNIKKKYITVNPGNTNDTTTRDGIVSLGEMQNIAYMVPAREVGGGQFWWRRGVLDVGYYTIQDKLTIDESFNAAFEFLEKIHDAMDKIKVSDLKDSYGEQAIHLFVYSSIFTQGGGPPASYLFRGQIFWQVLTARQR